jgi:hypothetical protein
VTYDLNLATFREELADSDFQTPRPLGELLSWTIEKMEHGIVHVTHPRYFGLLNPAPTFPAQCADRMADAFNPQLATSTTSPAAVEIEAHVIRRWLFCVSSLRRVLAMSGRSSVGWWLPAEYGSQSHRSKEAISSGHA